MAHGQVKCCGSSVFLKDVYGCGYNLSFNCETTEALNAVEQWVLGDLFKEFNRVAAQNADPARGGEKNVNVISKAGKEIMFLAPFDASALFEDVFTRIEREKDRFQVLSWALNVCNLEEVFLKV